MDDHPPRKRQSAKLSKTQSISDSIEMRELAEPIIQEARAKLIELDDPFDCYAHQLKMRCYQDAKTLGSRLVKGYEVLLEQLHFSSEDLPAKE